MAQRRTKSAAVPVITPAASPSTTVRWPLSPRQTTWLIVAAFGVVTAIIYANSLAVPYLFDDNPAIITNKSIRSLWTALSPPHSGETVDGRPLINLTLALNFALTGSALWSFHLVNILIHWAAGCTLFGVLRRTLQRTRWHEAALGLSVLITLLWLVHPLQTESVTYIVQRAESIVSLCYLLTLYCVIRVVETPLQQRRWSVLAVLACTAGMASKEVMFSAPIIALLYDRTFLAGTFRAAWQQRRYLYVGLFAGWILLAFLIDGRGNTAGFDTQLSPWAYAMTQTRAITRYLMLVVWPSPLIFDYGTLYEDNLLRAAAFGSVICVLLTGTVWALRHRPMLGFAGAAFFAILAPSSSIVPIYTQTVAEHRMYLALAVVITLLVLGGYQWIGRWTWRGGAVAALVLGGLTIARNRDYQTEISLWQDNVDKWPRNFRAQYALGRAYLLQQNTQAALGPLQESVRISSTYVPSQHDLGMVLAKMGRFDEARARFETVLKLNPNHGPALFNHAVIMAQMGRLDEARKEFALSAAQDTTAAGQASLGNALIRFQLLPEAVKAYTEAARLKPDSTDLQVNLGQLQVILGQHAEAAEHFRTALALNPNLPRVHNELGKALARMGRYDEAIEHFQQAIDRDPNFSEAHQNLAHTLELKRARPGG